jgi:hypothetical protein
MARIGSKSKIKGKVMKTIDESISKVSIQIELECKTIELENKLIALLDCVDSAKNETNQLYDDTNEQLKSLLILAIDKIKHKEGLVVGTIQNEETTLCSGWVGTITLYSVAQHYHPLPFPE